MANSLVLTGSLVVGPAGASDCGFPSGVTNISFGSTPAQKPAAASTGDQAISVNSPSPAWLGLPGVGTTVQQGNFLYIRTTGPMKFRLTQKDRDGGADIVSIVELQGVHVHEFPTDGYLKLLEAQGVGTVEYLVTGNS